MTEMIVTAGAGGVGKTTVAAAIAAHAAAEGRRAAVLTIDPARRLADALGLQALTGELRRVDPVHFRAAGLGDGGELWAMMLDTRTTGDQLVKRYAPDPQAAQAILDNAYYRFFSTSLAGAQEYMAIEQVRSLVGRGGFDLVVLDTPPAVHALDFLDAPDRLLGALDSKAVQLLRRREDAKEQGLVGKAGGLLFRSLSRLTGGGFLEDLATFLGLFASILDALRDASRELHSLLRAPTSQFLLVATPTRTNIDDAAHFRHELTRRGLPFGGFVCNRVHAPLPAVTSDRASLVRALAGTPAAPLSVERRGALVDRMLGGLADHHQMADRDANAIARLAHIGEAEPSVVPLFPRDVHDLAALDLVARHLRR